MNKKLRTADFLVQTLLQLGTSHIFSLSGNQIMPIYDALIGSGIRLIHTRHEASAVHMADAWGRLTNSIGVALIAGGPGFANGLSAMYVAKMAESPLVVLSGDVPAGQQGQGAFQEMAQAKMAAEVTKASWGLSDPAAIAADLQKAFHLARAGRPGPVHLSIPFDLLTQKTKLKAFAAPSDQTPPLRESEAKKMVAAIREAKRPLFLLGPAAGRHTNHPANLPIAHMTSPRGINDPALGAFAEVLAEADMLVLLGKKLDFTLKFGAEPIVKRETAVIQIDPDANALALSQKNGAALNLRQQKVGDPAQALSRLTQHNLALDAAWVSHVREAIAYRPAAWKTAVSPPNAPLFSAEVGQAIHHFLAEGEQSVLISDGGEFGQWMQATVTAPHRVINGPSGSIGNAIPFGLAARLAFPHARIVACTGDGAFGFQPLELETAVRYALPFITVVGNDARWNAEYQIQQRDYGTDRIFEVKLNSTRYHEVAQAVGGWGAQVTNQSDLLTALRTAQETNRPACINVTIQGEAAPIIRRNNA